MIDRTASRTVVIVSALLLALLASIPAARLALRYYRAVHARHVIAATLESPHWQSRAAQFEREAPRDGAVVLLGDSMIARFARLRTPDRVSVVNFGINGDFTTGVLQRLGAVVRLRPAKVFIEIGVNDVVERVEPAVVIANYRAIIRGIRGGSPTTRLYAQSIFPTALRSSWLRSSDSLNDTIRATNADLASLCRQEGITFIDLHPLFVRDNRLAAAFTVDGIHLNDQAYALWLDAIRRYVDD